MSEIHDADLCGDEICSECGNMNGLHKCDSCDKVICEDCIADVGDPDCPFELCELCVGLRSAAIGRREGHGGRAGSLCERRRSR